MYNFYIDTRAITKWTSSFKQSSFEYLPYSVLANLGEILSKQIECPISSDTNLLIENW